MLAPRGIMTLSLTDKNSSPLQDFARSKISDKNVNMELEASLCCTVIPIIEQSTKDGNTEDGIKS